MRRYDIYLGDALHKRLKQIGKKRGPKVSEIIRKMINEGLKKYGINEGE